MSAIDLGLDLTRDSGIDGKYFQDVFLEPSQEPVDGKALSEKSFSERVTILAAQGDICTWLVDRLVNVTGPSDAARAAAQKNWTSVRDNATWWSRFNIVLAAGSVVGSVASIVFPPLAIVGVVCLVASSVFAGKYYHQAQDAQTQIDKWSVHPARSIADARARAYSNGFFYAMNNGLKGTYGTHSQNNILHPSEVTWLYEQALMDMMKDVSAKLQRLNVNPQDKSKWVEGFVAQNPLSGSAISYAFDAADPKRMILEAWASSFEAFKQDVLSFRNQSKAEEQKVHDQAWKEIHGLEGKRNLALKPFLSLKNSNNDEAWRVRQAGLSAEGISEERRKEVICQYEQTLRNNEAIYLAATTPINLCYDSWRKNVEYWEENALQQIKQGKDQGVAFFFEPALHLFNGAYTAWYSLQIRA